MPDLRPTFAPIIALALCGLALASISPGRGSRSERSGELAAIATLSDGTSLPEPEPMQASCGDGRCSAPEDCNSCPADCGSCCGDGRCAPPEDARSCPRDCS